MRTSRAAGANGWRASTTDVAVGTELSRVGSHGVQREGAKPLRRKGKKAQPQPEPELPVSGQARDLPAPRSSLRRRFLASWRSFRGESLRLNWARPQPRPTGEIGRGLPRSKTWRPSGRGWQSLAGLPRFGSWWLMVFGLILKAPAGDHGLALAYPVDGSRLTIDGDLSDWPEGLPRYQVVGHCLAARPVDAEDGSAEFRLGYCEAENSLYVALEVQDAAKGEWA